MENLLFEKPKPPKGLCLEARQLWNQILEEYELNDAHLMAILKISIVAYDRMLATQRKIKKTGLFIKARDGGWIRNPLILMEKQFQDQFLLGLKSLHLDLEPLGKVGKPGKANGRIL